MIRVVTEAHFKTGGDPCVRLTYDRKDERVERQEVYKTGTIYMSMSRRGTWYTAMTRMRGQIGKE